MAPKWFVAFRLLLLPVAFGILDAMGAVRGLDCHIVHRCFDQKFGLNLDQDD